jgi:DNA-3-methyladenine glycosylase II
VRTPSSAAAAGLSQSLTTLRRGDPVLGKVIDAVGPGAIADPRRGYPRDHYGALVRAILGQQVSVAAASAMYARLLARYGGRTPTPQEVLSGEPETLRAAAGLSRAKVGFLRSLAQRVVAGTLNLEALGSRCDEEVLAELTSVKGIGAWTNADLPDAASRARDVVVPGDLGIRRAVMLAYERPALPTPDQVTALAEAWRPHRTLACRILWASQAETPL